MAGPDQILARLTALHPKVIDLSLGRIERLLEALGHPERNLPPVIHVAGTNGKGSVIATLRAVLEAAQYRVHSYTSPHLIRFNERIRLASGAGRSADITDDALETVLARAEQANGAAPITFFEITTAAAFLAFAEMPADIVLLEVGLGGRLDATNVIDRPALSVITEVSLDHQNFLGDTIEQIAGEKAGILKSGVTAVVGPQNAVASRVIERCAARAGAELKIAAQDWHAFEERGRLVFQDERGLLDLPLPRLFGRHQIDNAGTAIAALRLLGDLAIADGAFETGLDNTRWPGRLERLEPGRLYGSAPEGAEIWVDGGHNPAAGRALAASFADFEDRVSKPLILVCGMLDTKDAGQFLAAFKGLAARVMTLTVPGSEAAIPAEKLAGIAKAQGFAADAAAGLEDALDKLAKDYPQSPRIVICGSLYLAGHALAFHRGDGGNSQ